MGINPKYVKLTDSEGSVLALKSIGGKIVLALNGEEQHFMQTFNSISPVKLIGAIQEAAGLESSDPETWTYRTQAFEWAMEQAEGNVFNALQIARFIADGDEAAR